MLTFNDTFPPIPILYQSPFYYALPYAAMFLGILIIIIVLLARFPSLRKYRRKRNILIYLVTGLVLVLLIFQMDNATKRALVSCSIDNDTAKFYVEEVNQLNLYCENHGDRDASFYLVLSSVNASFPVQTRQTYLRVSSTTIKVPFLLQERELPVDAEIKPVFFTIDKNVTSFSFNISVEAHDSPVDVSMVLTDLLYVWNGTENCYILESCVRVVA
ncbi:MAG: hypothetical protein NWE94_01040 [Candidatus Bathyarchaeota archaeon]|nr:hypothetical protein [Candidatus Bathyarchaeota archaeon]